MTVAQLTLPSARYQPADRVTFVDRLAAQLGEIPGVNAAAVATSLPFTGNVGASILVPEGATGEDAPRRYYRNSVTTDFFSALGITPYNLVERLQQLIRNIADLGADAFKSAFGYFLIGAVIVFPIWFVVRLIRMSKGGPRA